MISDSLQPANSGPATLDDPLYYLHNFRWVLNWVHSRYADLLSDAERQFVADFEALPQASQGLLVRMAMRKGQCFRADKLCYDELGCTEMAVAPLVALRWIDATPKLDVETLFKLFTWADLRRPLANYLSQSGVTITRKGDALAFMAALELPPLTATEWGMAEVPVYEFLHMPLCDRFRLMFFGNLHQDWSEFVLTELGTYQYEPVDFTEASRPFHSRAEVDAYLQLHVCRERFYNDEPLEDIVGSLPALPGNNLWLARRRDKLLFKLAREYERAGELPQARELYQLCAHPGSRGRLLRVLELQGDYQTAFDLATLASDTPESETERQQLQRLMPRLRRKLGLPRQDVSEAGQTQLLELTLPYALPVELAAKQHLETGDAPVHYVENMLLNGLFGLLCWDAIFAPLPGAFFHPFQRGPADLHWPDFHQRRKDIFDRCLQLLEHGSYREQTLATFHSKYGRQSPFVFWDLLSEELLEQASNCIPAAHLQRIFERFLVDLQTNCAGLPDLIQFWPRENRYRLIEVKGPGDRLQDNQRRWLDYFAEHDIPVAVCHVRWQESGEAV